MKKGEKVWYVGGIYVCLGGKLEEFLSGWDKIFELLGWLKEEIEKLF